MPFHVYIVSLVPTPFLLVRGRGLGTRLCVDYTKLGVHIISEEDNLSKIPPVGVVHYPQVTQHRNAVSRDDYEALYRELQVRVCMDSQEDRPNG